MTRPYLFAIPIVIGIITGMVLTTFSEPNEGSTDLTVSNLVKGGSPTLGDPDAPITILEWGDYQCTFCYKFHENTLEIIKEDFIETGKVRLVFKDFPLNGPDSIKAAEATYCAEEQGKYWQYHDEIYKNWAGERTGWITEESLLKFADTINLDLDKFKSCINDEIHKKRVDKIHEFGKDIGIDATPSFLIFNDEKIIKVRGNQPLEVFLKAFNEL